MTDSNIERQAIRAALALAVASAHGQSTDAIVDLRDEAAQLIGLCMKERVATDGVRQWCDGTSALVERLSSDDQLPRQYALSATAAILRLRLAVAHSPAPDAVVPSRSTTALPKKAQPRITTPKVIVEGAQKLVLQFIEQHPDVRTKDLVDGLGKTLSPRTIKRCLKELATAGLLKRVRQEDRSVQYRVDTQS